MERLHLQSLFWPDAVEKKQVASYSHSFLAELAGNAVECSCMAAIVYFLRVCCLRRVRAEPWSCSRLGRPQAMTTRMMKVTSWSVCLGKVRGNKEQISPSSDHHLSRFWLGPPSIPCSRSADHGDLRDTLRYHCRPQKPGGHSKETTKYRGRPAGHGELRYMIPLQTATYLGTTAKGPLETTGD